LAKDDLDSKHNKLNLGGLLFADYDFRKEDCLAAMPCRANLAFHILDYKAYTCASLHPNGIGSTL
jgi:hypothetical protein